MRTIQKAFRIYGQEGDMIINISVHADEHLANASQMVADRLAGHARASKQAQVIHEYDTLLLSRCLPSSRPSPAPTNMSQLLR